MLLYADDLKVFRIIYNLTDCFQFQEDFKNCRNGVKSKKFPLNIQKCRQTTFSRNKSLINYNYRIQDTDLVKFYSRNNPINIRFHLSNHKQFQKRKMHVNFFNSLGNSKLMPTLYGLYYTKYVDKR